MSKVGKKRRWMLNNFQKLDDMLEDIDDPKYVVGADFSLTSSGLVVIDHESGDLVDEVQVSTSTSDGTIFERVLKARDEFSDFMEKYIDGLSFVGFEVMSAGGPKMQFSSIKKNVSTWITFFITLDSFDVDPVFVNCVSTQIKKVATGDHHAEKNQVLKGILKNFGEDFDLDDKADAYGAARIAWSLIGIKDAFLDELKDVDEDDMDKFLLSWDKCRIDVQDEFDREMMEVVISLMKNKGFAQKNDYDYYLETRKKIKEYYE